MSPRTGRPPKHGSGSSRTASSITIRITESEKNDIQFVADKLNISRTDAIMKGIEMLKEELTE